MDRFSFDSARFWNARLGQSPTTRDDAPRVYVRNAETRRSEPLSSRDDGEWPRRVHRTSADGEVIPTDSRDQVQPAIPLVGRGKRACK